MNIVFGKATTSRWSTSVIGALLTLCFAKPASAQAVSPSCMPYVTTVGWIASDPRMGVSKSGAWIRWICWSTTGQPDRIVAYAGTVPEFAKVGGRIATMVKAADPLKSLQTLPQRIPMVPFDDPSLAAVVTEMKATPW